VAVLTVYATFGTKAGVVAALREIDYDGWVVIEAFGDSLPGLAGATKIWRRTFDSEEQLARDGAAFIRSGLSL